MSVLSLPPQPTIFTLWGPIDYFDSSILSVPPPMLSADDSSFSELRVASLVVLISDQTQESFIHKLVTLLNFSECELTIRSAQTNVCLLDQPTLVLLVLVFNIIAVIAAFKFNNSLCGGLLLWILCQELMQHFISAITEALSGFHSTISHPLCITSMATNFIAHLQCINIVVVWKELRFDYVLITVNGEMTSYQCSNVHQRTASISQQHALCLCCPS